MASLSSIKYMDILENMMQNSDPIVLIQVHDLGALLLSEFLWRQEYKVPE